MFVRSLRVSAAFIMFLSVFQESSMASRKERQRIPSPLQISFGKGKKQQVPLPEVPPVEAEPGDDPLFESSWHLERIGAPEAWQTTFGERETLIAVVDSGVDYNHPDLVSAIWRNEADCDFDGEDDDQNDFIDDCVGWNFTEERSLPWDDNGHGTFIAGIIVGQHNNRLGGVGVCPGCSLLATRFLDSDGFGDDADAIRGINYAIDAGASVINLSFAGEGYDKPLRDVLKKALEHDVVIVAAAGNDGENNDTHDTYPANFRLPNLISVAAAKRDGELWQDSNYGVRNVHVAAPGTTIWGPWIDGKWYRSQGTSFSAPIVAGAAGLIRSANPALTAPQVVEILKNTVTPSSHLTRKIRTGGIINVAAAMACATHPHLPCLPGKKFLTNRTGRLKAASQ